MPLAAAALPMAPASAAALAAALQPQHDPVSRVATRYVDGARLVLRPVLPQDGARLAAMLCLQSPAALRWRFHGAVRPSPRWCERMSQVDRRQHLALVVCVASADDERLVAEARYGRIGDTPNADCALMVDTQWQRKGLGRWLLGALSRAAADAGLAQLECEVLPDNRAMLGLALRCGFVLQSEAQGGHLLRLRQRLGDGGGRSNGVAC